MPPIRCACTSSGSGSGVLSTLAADVEVVVVQLDDLRLIDQPRVLGDLPLVRKDKVDLLDILGPQLVLVLAFSEFPIGVDEQHLVPQFLRLALVDHQHAGWNAGAIEQTGRQADDGLDDVVAYEQLANQLFLAAAKQHAMWHDGRHAPLGFQAGHHVLDEHQVGLLAGFRAPLAKAAGELHVSPAVVLREWRIGKHTVEGANLAALSDLRILQRVPIPQS